MFSPSRLARVLIGFGAACGFVSMFQSVYGVQPVAFGMVAGFLFTVAAQYI